MTTLARMVKEGAFVAPSTVPDYAAYQASRNYLYKPEYEYTSPAVVVGRFQPLHKGHEDLIEGALKRFPQVLVVIGSAFEAQTIKNPFTYEMRRGMIEFRFRKELQEGRLKIEGLQDYTYRSPKWYDEFYKLCDKVFPPITWRGNKGKSYVLYTYGKDAATQEYIDGYRKDITKVYHESTSPHIHATDIRDLFFRAVPTLNIPDISGDVAVRLHTFKLTEEYARFCKEYDAVLEYRELWKPYKDESGKVIRNPFPVQFVAVDGLIVWKDRWGKPHFLVIKRKSDFGNGKLAIAGGYLDAGETILSAAKREVLEETGLAVDDSFILHHVRVFDDPARSLRGRMMTHVHHWQVCSETKPIVKGGDDAAEAFWMPFDEVYSNKCNFFSDHYYILSYFYPTVEGEF